MGDHGPSEARVLAGRHAPAAPQMSIRVSVLVPVFNPGEAIAALVESLDRQSMPPEQFEVIFIDDGSTDETPALLDRAARARPNFRVIHQPNFGWPSQPRNVGIETAAGDFVYFCDHDDWLGDEALERMVAMADRNGSDIVIGKMVGHGRGVPHELFRHNVDRAKLENSLLMTSLTPHKLFRRSFLLEHGLRFPEDRRRLEDHVFVVRAYLLAANISVLSDYVCYHHTRRQDGRNAAHTMPDPSSYYAVVGDVLTIIEARTPAGDLRDRLFGRSLQQEVLRRLEGMPFLRLSGDARRTWFDAAHQLVTTRYPTSVEERLGTRERVLTALLRAGNYRDMVRAAQWTTAISLQSVVLRGSTQGSYLVLNGRAELNAPHGPPFVIDGERHLLALPVKGMSDRLLDVTDDLQRADLRLRARAEDGNEILIPTSMGITIDKTVTLHWHARIAFSPRSVGLRLPAGRWKLKLRFRALGWTFDAPVRGSASRMLGTRIGRHRSAMIDVFDARRRPRLHRLPSTRRTQSSLTALES